MRGTDEFANNRARKLRRASTDAETALWYALRNRALNGYKFVRQAPIGPYFADFLCRDHMLVVEVDGSQHYDNARDERRDDWLLSQGCSILRVGNADVLARRSIVLESIVAALEGRLDPQSSPELKFKSSNARVPRG